MTTARELTPVSPFRLRLGAYLKERFPVAGHGIMVVSYYAASHALARALVEPEAPIVVSPRLLAGVVTLFLFFFHLRVFDEHKDFATDGRFHTERVLQRGLITLRELRILGGAAIAIEFILAAVSGPAALLALGAAFVYSLLMLKEFFVHEWLSRRLVAYAVTHMLVMPLLTLVAFSFATGVAFWKAPPAYWLFVGASFFLGMGLEISRKIRAPENEIDGVETYSSILGTYRAAYMVFWIRALDVALLIILGRMLGLPFWYAGALIALWILTVGAVAVFRTRTTTAAAERLESFAALHLMAANVVLAVAVVLSTGLEGRWTW